MNVASRLLVALLLALAGGPLSAQTLRTLAGNRQLSGQDELNVNVTFAAGRLAIGRDDSGMLYRARVVYDEDRFEPILAYAAPDRSLTVGVSGLRGVGHRDEGAKQEVRLDVSPRVPVRFNIKFGAGEADVDLGGLNLVRAEINTGATDATVRFSTPTTGRCENATFHVGAAAFRAERLANARCRTLDFAGGVGDLTLDFSGDWGPVSRPEVDVSVGMGSLTLRFPRTVGVRLDVARLFSSFERSGLVQRDGAYYSPNYDSAAVRVHLDVKAALGSIDVQWQ